MWHRFNLLVIEPTLEGRIVLRSHLEKLNYSVDFAWDIESTLTQTDTKFYDFILIDEKLDTQISCSKLIDSLHRKSKLNQETPIVFLYSSSNLEQPKSEQCHSFRRPVTGNDVLELMEFLLKLKLLSA
ncbi:response regulator [Legionella maceachernii]|uniref:Response regulator receiver n=1 Tax=Legionella maceachernii TaxID=466 RepID=A0A0W0WCF6_9GAMM|nr:response regulator [Legionella maceachernii]KTD29686.1 Response regulator receiver [Legionella maceachernii]SKA21115.1 Response regulator receiver domain-containing protein [Legionella maceachernii]SUP02574.1 Uncharacterised protein [Legionella maceachernii]